MVNTYTTSWDTVSNGDRTYLTPQNLVATNEAIAVSNAEVQWEGVTTTTTSTENVNRYNRTEKTGNTVKEQSRIDTGDKVNHPSFPTHPSDSQFVSHTANWNAAIVNDTQQEVSGTIEYRVGGNTVKSENFTIGPKDPDSIYINKINVSYTWESTNNHIGESIRIVTGPFDDDSDVYLSTNYDGNGYEAITSYDDPDAGSFTLSETYPTLVSDEDFGNHDYTAKIWYPDGDGEYPVTVDYDSISESGTESLTIDDYSSGVPEISVYGIYTNYEGETATLTIQDTNSNTYTAELELETEGSKTTTITKDTNDPRVTADVTGDSGGITLNDGEQSSWFSLTGLQASETELYHDIDGSGEARYRVRFEYEEIYPDVLGELRVHRPNDDTKHVVVLADPTDSNLKSNAFRTTINGTTYAFDVTRPDDTNALPSHTMYHPTSGEWVLRSYEQL